MINVRPPENLTPINTFKFIIKYMSSNKSRLKYDETTLDNTGSGIEPVLNIANSAIKALDLYIISSDNIESVKISDDHTSAIRERLGALSFMGMTINNGLSLAQISFHLYYSTARCGDLVCILRAILQVVSFVEPIYFTNCLIEKRKDDGSYTASHGFCVISKDKINCEAVDFECFLSNFNFRNVVFVDPWIHSTFTTSEEDKRLWRSKIACLGVDDFYNGRVIIQYSKTIQELESEEPRYYSILKEKLFMNLVDTFRVTYARNKGLGGELRSISSPIRSEDFRITSALRYAELYARHELDNEEDKSWNEIIQSCCIRQ